MRNENKVGGITIPDIKLYYKATIIKTTWYWLKNRDIDQWKRTGSPEINPCLYSQLIVAREARPYDGVKTVSLINGVRKIRQVYTHTHTKETRSQNYIIQKNKLKMDKDLNVICETIKILEDNISNKISDISLEIFLLISLLEHRK